MPFAFCDRQYNYFFILSCGMNRNFILGSIAFIALVIIVFAAWAHITHQSYAPTLMTAAKISQVVGTAALFILLVFWLRKKK